MKNTLTQNVPHFVVLEKRSWTKVKHIISGPKKGRKTSSWTKKSHFHCNSLTCSKCQAKKGKEKRLDINGRRCPREEKGLCMHYGLCSRGVKQFKRRVKSIHQIVWNCEENSKTIWPPNVWVLFVRWDTLVSALLPAGDRAGSIVTCHIGEGISFVPSFHALRSKLWPRPAAPQNKKTPIKAQENWPKTLCFCGIPDPLFSPSTRFAILT